MPTTHTTPIPTRNVEQAIRDERAFTTHGSMRAQKFVSSIGELPNDYIGFLVIAEDASDFYVVYSYDTPIAWRDHGVWTIPNVKYSTTTSKHQNIVRRATK